MWVAGSLRLEARAHKPPLRRVKGDVESGSEELDPEEMMLGSAVRKAPRVQKSSKPGIKAQKKANASNRDPGWKRWRASPTMAGFGSGAWTLDRVLREAS